MAAFFAELKERHLKAQEERKHLSFSNLVHEQDIEIMTYSLPNDFTPLRMIDVSCCGNRSLYTFGHGYYGRLGNGISGYYDLVSPYKISNFELTNICSVKMSTAHVLVLLSNGQMYSFGKCHFGQLGLGYEWMDVFTPHLIPLRVSIKVISTGSHHSLAIDQNGKAYSWGCGFHGALGLGDEKSRTSPHIISTLPGNCIDISGGRGHSLAVVATDSESHQIVYSWGKGGQGQLGLDDESCCNVLSPLPVSFFQFCKIASIHARSDFSAALIDDGSNLILYTWGSNSHGQLGHCFDSQRTFLISDDDRLALHDNRILDQAVGSKVPIRIDSPSSSGWKIIACGGQHCIGIDANDNLYGWGYGPSFGLFENENKTCVAIPSPLPPPIIPYAVTSLTCGTRHSLISYANGRTFAIGVNNSGQLGTGDHEWKNNWTEIEINDSHNHLCIGAAGGTNSSVLILETIS